MDGTQTPRHDRAVPTDASTSASTNTLRVELLQLPAAVIHSLADGDLASANDFVASAGVTGQAWTTCGPIPLDGRHQAGPLTLTSYLVTPESRRTWQMRSEQISRDPEAASWITRVAYDPERRLVVGKAGFHGPPDASGMVEIGYATDPDLRRRGYARAAVEAMLGHARRSPGVRTVRASISPDNAASLRLVAQFGFAAVGEQIDEEDGLEIIYEVDL